MCGVYVCVCVYDVCVGCVCVGYVLCLYVCCVCVCVCMWVVCTYRVYVCVFSVCMCKQPLQGWKEEAEMFSVLLEKALAENLFCCNHWLSDKLFLMNITLGRRGCPGIFILLGVCAEEDFGLFV